MGKTVVIGGHSRNIGKTSVMARIINGVSDIPWVAVKITQYGHGICGPSCGCGGKQHSFAIDEETEYSSGTDTSRFLAAGARKAFWVRTRQGMLSEAMPALRSLMADHTHLIMESNSILQFFRPDLYLVVLDSSVTDFKASARKYLDRADGCVWIESAAGPSWKDVSLKLVSGKPAFAVPRGEYCAPELLDFVRKRMMYGIFPGS